MTQRSLPASRQCHSSRPSARRGRASSSTWRTLSTRTSCWTVCVPTSRSCSRTSPTSASSSWIAAPLGTPRSISRRVTTLVGTPSTWRTWSSKSSGPNGGWKSTKRLTGPSMKIEVYVFTLRGRHRSLANQRLLQFIVEDYGVPQWDLNHLNQFGRHNCGGGCADCRWEAPGAREKAMVCVDLARKLWKENAEELKASKAGGAGVPSSAGAASDPSGGASSPPSAPSAPSLRWSRLGPQSLRQEPRSRRRPRRGLRTSPRPSKCRGPLLSRLRRSKGKPQRKPEEVKKEGASCGGQGARDAASG